MESPLGVHQAPEGLGVTRTGPFSFAGSVESPGPDSLSPSSAGLHLNQHKTPLLGTQSSSQGNACDFLMPQNGYRFQFCSRR